MTNTPTVVLSVVLASAAAAGVSLSMRSAATPPPTDANAALQREVTELRTSLAALQKQIEAARTAPVQASLAPATERTVATEEQIAAAVEAALQRRDAKANGGGAASVEGAFDLAKDFPALVGTSYWGNTAKWKKAFDAGRIDEVLAKFEAAAKASPNDPQSQMNLANAYLARLQMQPGDYSDSRRADQALDKVLEIDPAHWEGRFTKAMSYTFWPEFTGKPKEAIAHFETLVKQQETMPVEDDQAATYLYLGNLLEKSDPAKAKQYFQQGARRHPNNAELQKKAAR